MEKPVMEKHVIEKHGIEKHDIEKQGIEKQGIEKHGIEKHECLGDVPLNGGWLESHSGASGKKTKQIDIFI
jgi:hypothetical protein